MAALRQDEVVALLDYLRKGGAQLALKSGYVEKQAVDSRKVRPNLGHTAARRRVRTF